MSVKVQVIGNSSTSDDRVVFLSEDDDDDATTEKTGLLSSHSQGSSRKAQSSESSINWRLLGATLAALIGSSAQFGYGIAVLNNVRPVIISDFQSNTTCSPDYDVDNKATTSSRRMFELATAVFCVGGLFGSLAGGWLADFAGRKYSLLVNNLFSIAGVLIMAFSSTYSMLIGGRFVEGFSSGIAMVVVSAYIGEIAPTSVRGAIGTLNQLTISTFILVSTALGLPYVLGSCSLWSWVVGGPVVLAVLQLISLPFFPRSPRYLYIDKNQPDAAAEALRRLRLPEHDVGEELGEMRSEKERQDRLPRINFLQVLLHRKFRFRLMLTAVLHTSQQFTGINGVFYYSSAIYTSAGLSHVALFALLPAVLNVAFVIVSVKLMDRLGRRSLMLTGLGGMCFSYVILTAGLCFEDGFFGSSDSSQASGGNWTAVFSIAGSLGVVAFFSIGPGPVPWMIVNELFPQNTRATAYAFAGVVNWTANYLIGQFYLSILESTHPYGFSVFAAISLLYTVLIYYLQPETKGKKIDEIDAYFINRVNDDEGMAKATAGLGCCFSAGKDTVS